MKEVTKPRKNNNFPIRIYTNIGKDTAAWILDEAEKRSLLPASFVRQLIEERRKELQNA